MATYTIFNFINLPEVKIAYHVVEHPAFAVAVTANHELLTTITDQIFYNWLIKFIEQSKAKVMKRVEREYRKHYKNRPWNVYFNEVFEVIEAIKYALREDLAVRGIRE
jgi:hypothetical protein